jgi:hypothetical protein
MFLRIVRFYKACLVARVKVPKYSRFKQSGISERTALEAQAGV